MFPDLGWHCLSCLVISAILKACHLLKLFWIRCYNVQHSSQWPLRHVDHELLLEIVEKWYLNGVWPTHLSLQNLICISSLVMKDPQDKTWSLILITPSKNGTCIVWLNPKYVILSVHTYFVAKTAICLLYFASLLPICSKGICFGSQGQKCPDCFDILDGRWCPILWGDTFCYLYPLASKIVISTGQVF
jgi:hypothetical protein